MSAVDMEGVLALILAGGAGQRLSILAEERAKPAVPFAGKYRIIDFTLTNCANSGISKIGVLTQHLPQSLSEHLGLGVPWDLDRRGGLSILQPHTGRNRGGWYQGTADAVYQNLNFVERSQARSDEIHNLLALILAGDHIYKMRYDEMVAFHRARNADVTVGVLEVPREEASRFGVMALGPDGQIIDFEEKPAYPRFTLASMGIYLFSTGLLGRTLREDARRPGSTHDFGRDILPLLIGKARIFGYQFKGYWRDVGTVESFWKANMEFLDDPPPLDLGFGRERVRTRPQDRPPAKIGATAAVQKTLIGHGCIVHGTVRNSVLFQGVLVEPGAVVEDSILFDDAVIRRDALLHRVIVDKEAVIGEGAMVGLGNDYTPNHDEPSHLSTGISLVGKRAVIPASARIGRNCKIIPTTEITDFPADGVVASGRTVQRHVSQSEMTLSPGE